MRRLQAELMKGKKLRGGRDGEKLSRQESAAAATTAADAIEEDGKTVLSSSMI